MRFSFILPVRNGGNYIKECVTSILAQTLNDFNLIILGNKSTDGTAEWLQTLTDKRIIVIPAETSLTIEENWARIVEIQKNEFITITGHDDLFDTNYLQVMNDLILVRRRGIALLRVQDNILNTIHHIGFRNIRHRNGRDALEPDQRQRKMFRQPAQHLAYRFSGAEQFRIDLG